MEKDSSLDFELLGNLGLIELAQNLPRQEENLKEFDLPALLLLLECDLAWFP